MKKYLKEIIIILLQIALFLTLIINVISSNKLKYFYPLIAIIIFIPSLFIYYNSSAWIHVLWYLIDSLFGEVIGICIYKLKHNKK